MKNLVEIKSKFESGQDIRGFRKRVEFYFNNLEAEVNLVAGNPRPIVVPKFPKRNSKCPCGSGLKFKNCHQVLMKYEQSEANS